MAGANPNTKTRTKWTPLHTVAKCMTTRFGVSKKKQKDGTSKRREIALLLVAVMDVNQREKGGMTPLDIAIGFAFPSDSQD